MIKVQTQYRILAFGFLNYDNFDDQRALTMAIMQKRYFSVLLQANIVQNLQTKKYLHATTKSSVWMCH